MSIVIHWIRKCHILEQFKHISVQHMWLNIQYAVHTKNLLYPMAKNYNEVGHGSDSSLKVIGIESIPCTIRIDWKQIEMS